MLLSWPQKSVGQKAISSEADYWPRLLHTGLSLSVLKLATLTGLVSQHGNITFKREEKQKIIPSYLQPAAPCAFGP